MNKFKIWFNSVRLPYSVKILLTNEYKSLEDIYQKAVDRRCFNDKINKELIKAYDYNKIVNIQEKLKKINGDIISVYDDNYPSNLKTLSDYPTTIYYIGDIRQINLNKNIAVVGSRKCSYYGEDSTRYIVKELAENRVNIVSGVALGIDAIAHEEALKNNSFTVGVLGCGIDVIYPLKNKKIFHDIYEKGCVLSEFELGTQPLKRNFPVRNRLISGISEMLIISEATINSGTMITANHALYQGREVMVVPGSIFSEYSKGTNMLIKDGANPLINLEDMLKCIGIEKKAEDLEKIKILDKYKGIYEVIDDSPIHVDDIIKITKIDISVLYELLFEMQFKKIIKCINGNYYVKNNFMND